MEIEPKADVIEIFRGDNEKGYTLLKIHIIARIPSYDKYFIFSFDNFFSPSFQGLIIHDVFQDYNTAFESIIKTNKFDSKCYSNISSGIAIAGYIGQTHLLLIENAIPIKFQNQEIIYKVQSFKKIQFQKENWKKNATSYSTDDFYFSFDSNILSFQDKKNNKNYNYLHLNQKPFRRLQVNICPFIINGYVKHKKISENSEILLLCRRSSSSKTIASGMNENGITRNQAEIEMVISERKKDSVELSYFTVSFGDIPLSYKLNDIKGQIYYEIGENSFLDTPKLIYNLLGDRKEKIKNEVFLIDLTQEHQKQQSDKLNEAMRKMVNFLSGVFNIRHIKFNFNTEKSEKEILDEICSLLPNVKIRKQIFYDNKLYQINDADQAFYVYSNHGNLNAEFVSLILLSKAIKMILPELENPERFLFTLISPFYMKFVNLIKSHLPFLKELVESQQPNKASEPDNYPPPLNMERCVSLFPVSTIIEPKDVDHHILSLNTTFHFYKSPEKSIIINLTEVCQISRILFMPASSTKTGNIYNITPSIVSVYGGLYLNQMFPIVENLVLAPTVETSFRVNLKKSDIYSTELKCSKYGKVRFVSFQFNSPFEAFYISNIYVFTDGSEVLEFPKKLKDQNFDVLKNGYDLPFLENEIKRIENLESNQLFAFRNYDKIQDMINVDSFFSNHSNSRKTEEQINSFNEINDNLMKNEMIMISKKYPFLCKPFKLESNFMKHYSYNSLYVPFLVASGPPLFEYVNSQVSELEIFKTFQPKESIVFIKVVLLQSYSLESIEIRCNSPLLVEVLNSNNIIFSNIFSPPGNVLPFISYERVFDIKLIGNPINISFLGFRPIPCRLSNEVNVRNSIDFDRENIIKCQQKEYSIVDSKIDNLDPSMKIIGIKLNRKHFSNFVPQYFLFDNRAMFVKMNPSSTFFFPEIISCRSIKIFFKGYDKNQKVFSDAVIIELKEKQEIGGNEVTFQKAFNEMPQSIQIIGNSSFSPMNFLKMIGTHT